MCCMGMLNQKLIEGREAFQSRCPFPGMAIPFPANGLSGNGNCVLRMEITLSMLLFAESHLLIEITIIICFEDHEAS